MNNSIRNIIFVIIGLVTLFFSCDNENEFYEVGRQPVHLLYPTSDTVWILNYQKPDTMHRFRWTSKRNFIDFNLVFSLSEDLTEKHIEIPTGIKNDFYMTTMQVDSVLSSMDIQIGKKAVVYWSVSVVDPEVGWCDEVRKVNMTRCDLPTNVIMLDKPASLAEINLDKKKPEDKIEFNWNCETVVEDYVLQLSFNKNLSDSVAIECGSAKSHTFTHEYLDNLLKERGIGLGKSTSLYWRVTGTGNLNNPIENSAAREIKVKRFARDPVAIELKAPANDSEIFLEAVNAGEQIEFKWDCDTTGVTFKLKLFDTELGVEEIINTGEEKKFTITQQDFDQLLEQKFEMVPSQKKKMYWQVITSDTLRAVSKETGNFTTRRFVASGAAPLITLVNAPDDNTSYTLDYNSANAVLTNMTWNCAANGITYAIEYSLNADMSQPRTKELNNSKSFGFTHKFLDDMMTDLGVDYMTKAIYWRITSTVNILTEPSETRSLILTGMVKPLLDKRDSGKTETYGVVKIGNNFWMAENLRATMYSDGTTFTSVDLPSKAYGGTFVSDPKVLGQYYSWPTALRTWKQAGTGDNTVIQGVCPDGWHVSTMADWNALVAELSPGSGLKTKTTQYWSNQVGITNSSGLSLAPGGFFWHGNVSNTDMINADAESYFWTTSVNPSDSQTAYAYIANNGNDNLFVWFYPSRPWSEGDGTASRVFNVRCVRTLE